MSNREGAIQLSPLGRVSPTLAEALRGCGLRAVLGGSESTRLLRRMRPPMALGVVAHGIIEQALRGQILQRGSDVRPALDHAWDAAVGEQQLRMSEESPFGAPPPPERWPGYQRVRVRTLRLAEQLAHTPRAAPEHVPTNKRRELHLEEAIVSEDGALVGRPDRVIEDGGDTRIVDLKTGRRAGSDLSDRERRQLLFYAALWHDRSGKWPSHAAIETGSAAPIELAIEPSEATQVVEAAVAERDRVNGLLAAGATARDLARVDDEECAHCAFRVVCDTYLESLEPTDRFGADLLGQIGDVASDGSVRLAVEHGSMDADNVRVRGLLPGAGPIRPGGRIALQDLVRVPMSVDVGVTWSSDYWCREDATGSS